MKKSKRVQLLSIDLNTRVEVNPDYSWLGHWSKTQEFNGAAVPHDDGRYFISKNARTIDEARIDYKRFLQLIYGDVEPLVLWASAQIEIRGVEQQIKTVAESGFATDVLPDSFDCRAHLKKLARMLKAIGIGEKAINRAIDNAIGKILKEKELAELEPNTTVEEVAQ